MRIDRLELDIVRRCSGVGRKMDRPDRFCQLLSDLDPFDMEGVRDRCCQGGVRSRAI